ncbi:MAG TPA: RNA polymerase sigma factor [Longimicrobium sp.]|nr:RNA polymerase sigma factor [Longimicrobium sp.]
MTDEETLLALLTTHGAALRRIARAYGGAHGEEDDLHQEILLQLWRGLPSFRGDAAPGTWLYRVALNTALTWRRRAARRARGDAARPERPAVSAGAPRSEAAILAEFLESLTPVDRSVLLLHMEGLAYADIAQVTGLSAGAVGVRLHRIRQTFTTRYVE